MKCPQCGKNWHLAQGVCSSELMRSKKSVKTKLATLRWCMNKECEHYGIIYNRCRGCGKWVMTSDGNAVPCKCREEVVNEINSRP